MSSLSSPSPAVYGLPSMMQIRATNVVGYHAFRHQQKHLDFLSKQMKESQVRKKAYRGRLSYGAKKRLSKCLQIMACVTPQRRLVHPVSQQMFNFRLNFITLTFPIQLTKEQEKNAPIIYLKPLLQQLQRRFDVKNYVWRAELTQQSRLHFHLVIDQPIHYLNLRFAWNRILRKAGFLDSFARQHKHYNANSTDVRMIKNLAKALKYTSKYLTKAAPGSRDLACKLWDSSLFLKTASWSTLEVGQATWQDIIHGLTGNEEGVLLDSRFFVVANRFLKRVPSTFKWIIQQITDWVTQMRVDCGWLAAEFGYLELIPPPLELIPVIEPLPQSFYRQIDLFQL
jgi:hypothetical protein